MSRLPRVLVVDDSDAVRSLIRVNLELEGFDVVTACDGQQALDQVADVDPDLITLDVVMPNLDGLSTATALRERADTRHIPLLMVTARAQESDVTRGKAVGADAYLTKPFDPAELVATVRGLLGLDEG